MNIDISTHAGLVYKNLQSHGIPEDIREDVYQDFCAYYYEFKDKNYDGSTKESTWLYLCFRNFLWHQAQLYNAQKRKGLKPVELDAQNPEFLDSLQEDGEEKESDSVYWQELLEGASPLLQEWLLERASEAGTSDSWEKGVAAKLAEEQGVSRQAVEKRIKRELKKLIGARMREIKFRAWNKKLKRFAPDEASIQIGGDDPCVAFDYFDGNFDTEVWPLADCDLLRYTGLKDVNGVEIYEGDIVRKYWGCYTYGSTRIDNYRNHLIKYRQSGSNIKWLLGDIGNTEGDTYNGWGDESVEIIGNKYENPELLDK